QPDVLFTPERIDRAGGACGIDEHIHRAWTNFEDPRLGVVRACREDRASDSAERPGSTSPLTPGVISLPAARVEHSSVVDPVTQHTGTSDHIGRPPDAECPQNIATRPSPALFLVLRRP